MLDKYIEKRYTNITTSVIEITEDKLELILQKDIKKIKDSSNISGAVGIFVSLLVAVLTTDNYKSFIGVSGEVWQITFLICLAVSLAYMLYCILSRYRNKIDIQDVIDHIKDC